MSNKLKKLFISSYSLELGGIETALVSLVNKLVETNEYQITLCLEKKGGLFYNDISKKVEIIEFGLSEDKNILKRFFTNLKRRKEFKAKYENKFDFSIAYATYSKPASFTARIASNNSTLFVHNDYSGIYEDPKEYIGFFKGLKFEEFQNIVFVSESGKENFLQSLLKYDDSKLTENITAKKIMHIHNYIDYEKMLKLSEEKLTNEEDQIINEAKKQDKTIFVNISRHDEPSKKLSRILDSATMLKQDHIDDYLIIFVGEGKETELYKEIVKTNGLR